MCVKLPTLIIETLTIIDYLCTGIVCMVGFLNVFVIYTREVTQRVLFYFENLKITYSNVEQ